MNIQKEYMELLVKQEVEKTVKQKINEIKGIYFPKSYIESIINKIIWETIYEKIPNVEQHLQQQIKKAVQNQINNYPDISSAKLAQMVSEEILKEIKRSDNLAKNLC